MLAEIKAFFQEDCNHALAGRKYSFLMTYGARLQTAMDEARVDRKTLAKKLSITVQALGQVLGGKTKALDALHHTRAALFLHCDPLWLAAGGTRHMAPAAPVAEQPPANYDHLPRGITAAERDVIQSYRQLPDRRQAELRESIMAEARQHMEDFRELSARHRATAPASPERVAAALPVRPDGEQPNTEPGTLT